MNANHEDYQIDTNAAGQEHAGKRELLLPDAGLEVEKRKDDWGWAMLRFDECWLMVDQSINAHPAKLRDSIVYLYPDDVVEYHRQVQKNGLAVPELTVTFYGLTEFRISDPDGNRLWIGQSTSKEAKP